MPGTDIEADELPPVEAVEDEAPTDEAPAVAEDAAEAEAVDDSGEIEISFDGETVATAAPAPESDLIRQFRKRQRELAAENARLKAEREAAPVVQPVVETLGPMPTLEDFGYDEDRFAAAVEERAQQRLAIERAQAERANAAAAQAAADQAELAEYAKSRAALGARDYADAEADFVEAVPNTLSQRVVLRAANNPAAVIYALGKSPAKLAQLAAITDPIKLAAAVAVMETKMTVTRKASTVQPEKRVTGGAPISSGGPDRYLAKLEAEADKTGDRTKIYQYKRSLAAKAAAR